MKYQSKLDLKKTQFAIKDIKDFFQLCLKKNMNLERITGPIIIEPSTGLNDDLTGNKNAVSFFVDDLKKNIEVVQSLAKWKRFALRKYGFSINEGIYVDMNAIRSHEKLDELHSLYVDQWDWELIIDSDDRNINKLKEIVKKIYLCIYETEKNINKKYPFLKNKLPKEITFFDSQELEDLYPNLSFSEIVSIVTKQFKAVFIMKIGKTLKSGLVFDERSPEYDDWELNGDLFVWSDTMQQPIELSSMGIRVDKYSLIKQTKKDDNNFNEYYQLIIDDVLDQTIGGGIGQSRLCMFLLEKKHIGEVQVSVWDKKYIDELEKEGINLL